MPVVPYERVHLNFFIDIVAQHMPDLILLQMDPMPYITRQRYMSHKVAMHGVEDYSTKAI